MTNQILDKKTSKMHLGGNVFVEIEHGALKISTKNRTKETNVIFLRYEMLCLLGKYINAIIQTAKIDCWKKWKEQLKRENESPTSTRK